MTQTTKNRLAREAVMAQHEPQKPSVGPARITRKGFFERLHDMAPRSPQTQTAGMSGIIRGGQS